MTDVQRQATAAGFLHVLQQSPEVFNEWDKVKKDDYAALGHLVRKTVGLSETPNKDDIQAMAKHIAARLKDETAKFHQAHAGVEHHVGTIAMMQQS
jgi:hypothetical protein